MPRHIEPRWRALLVLAAARTSLGFQFQSIASVSPELIADLGLGYGELGTLIGLYFLPGVAIALPGAALGRRFGDTRVVGIGLGLMVVGGLTTALAPGLAMLAAGRLVSGIGAVLLNVLMSKMATDWFAGERDLTLAMAVLVNSFPVGLGLATLTLAPLSARAGWAAGLSIAAGFALLAFLLLRLGYRQHPNDGTSEGGGALFNLSGREASLVSLAAIMWSSLNGGLGVMFGFAPSFLAQGGIGSAAAGLIVGAATWLVVIAGHAGGVMAQRGSRIMLLMLLGTLGWACCLVVLAIVPGVQAPAILLSGLLMGLPAGVLMSLTARVLRPENRAIGMGLFYVWHYAGLAGLPPLAGWMGDLTRSGSAPLLFAALLVAAILPLFLLFGRLAATRHH